MASAEPVAAVALRVADFLTKLALRADAVLGIMAAAFARTLLLHILNCLGRHAWERVVMLSSSEESWRDMPVVAIPVLAIKVKAGISRDQGADIKGDPIALCQPAVLHTPVVIININRIGAVTSGLDNGVSLSLELDDLLPFVNVEEVCSPLGLSLFPVGSLAGIINDIVLCEAGGSLEERDGDSDSCLFHGILQSSIRIQSLLVSSDFSTRSLLRYSVLR
jgi:hypothetical protein